jgi:nucleoside-diphosphate-sugar epimerase
MGALSGAHVLVTGATGFIGTHLVNRLRTEELSRLALLSRHPIEEVRGYEVAIAGDLAEIRSTTWSSASSDEFDVVFHLGGAMPRAVDKGPSPGDIVRSNVLGTQSLLGSLQSRPCRFVFTSTVDVFLPSDGVIDETSPTRSTGLYPVSKLMGEALVSNWARQTGSSAVIGRLGHIYGPGEGAFGKAIPTWIRAALEDLPLIVYGDGSVLRDLLYVTDAVEALIRAATVSYDEPSTVVILASSSSTAVAELAQQIADIVGKPGLVKFARDWDSGYSTRFSTEHMNRLLGNWSRVPLRDGLIAEVEYFRGEVART